MSQVLRVLQFVSGASGFRAFLTAWRTRSTTPAVRPFQPSFTVNLSRLDMTANVCVIAASIAVVASIGSRLWSGNATAYPPAPAPYKIGDSLPAVDGIHYDDASMTVLLYINSNCTFCVESMPFYAEIANVPKPRSFQVVLLGRESHAALARFAASYGLKADRLLSVSRDALRVPGTPTLIVADPTGRVLGYWPGLLKGREKEVLALLRRTT